MPLLAGETFLKADLDAKTKYYKRALVGPQILEFHSINVPKNTQKYKKFVQNQKK